MSGLRKTTESADMVVRVSRESERRNRVACDPEVLTEIESVAVDTDVREDRQAGREVVRAAMVRIMMGVRVIVQID